MHFFLIHFKAADIGETDTGGTRGGGEVLGQAGGHDVCANYLKWD